MSTQCVLLSDHSLLMEGIGAYLAGRPGLHLVRLEPDTESLTEVVASLQPDFVIYEINTLQVEQLASLLAACPGLQIVGVHLEHSGLVVISQCVHRFVAMQDLLALLEIARPAAQTAEDFVNRASSVRGATVFAGSHEEMESSHETGIGNRR